MPKAILPDDIANTVKHALAEDIGPGDLTAMLVPEDAEGEATIISRDQAIFCGSAWLDEVYKQVDTNVKVEWLVSDGEQVTPNQTLCKISGNARAMVTGERTALNFLQTLSGTATMAQKFAKRITGTKAAVRDTRKTLPGLRKAQKYAVCCGGCENHRMGLYDAVLIKENHIIAAGSITEAVRQAKMLRDAHGNAVPVEVEVETIAQLDEAVHAGAELVLVDNFSIPMLNKAVARNSDHKKYNRGQAKVEASGGITWENARSIADTGVDYLAVGTLTKDLESVDLSMRFAEET
jgi:nicotinate-nucleotide pyrophosphorylase (carboxylating)